MPGMPAVDRPEDITSLRRPSSLRGAAAESMAASSLDPMIRALLFGGGIRKASEGPTSPQARRRCHGCHGFCSRASSGRSWHRSDTGPSKAECHDRHCGSRLTSPRPSVDISTVGPPADRSYAPIASNPR